MSRRIAALLPLLGGCLFTEGVSPNPEKKGGHDGTPVVKRVTIDPQVPYVDGPVSCRVDGVDPDGDDVEVSYRWRNVDRSTTLGRRADIELDPNEISPGEELRCEATVTDTDGNAAFGEDSVVPGCGFADPASLADMNLSVYVIFRPYITDELIPGYELEPWDWDGNIPDWILDVVDVLDTLLDIASQVYPDPELMTAAEAVGMAGDVLDAIDKYGPELMEGTVPPDPDIFPYVIDADGYLYTYWDESEGGIQWDNSYEVSIDLPRQDFYTYSGLALDMEDVDLAYNDNMGDYLDQDSTPLVLAWPIFLDGAYCTSTYVNPSSHAQESDAAYVRSSVLFMTVDVW